MNSFKLLLTVLFLASVTASAMDEADIPPPPMPDYMKKHEFESAEPERRVASQPNQSMDQQSEEEIKNEFLQAADENESANDGHSAQPSPEEPEASQREVSEAPEAVYEEVSDPAPIEEVSEVEVAEPELEQARISPDQEVNATENYQKDVGNLPPAEVIDEEVSTEEKLAEVEESLEAAEQKTESQISGRAPSSKAPFKAGMYKFAKNCSMYSEPSTMSDKSGSINAGRKLWIDAHDDSWHKAYKKSGAVYIPADCLK